ncbi:MAG: TolC family protein [Candidatus Eisenbacteria bacterium]|uniref:TolC family protein n=1 Tax=Eiseniibacteriota bacterium TaxID=2212470 RepID=A0A938BKP4_UNCEI|nr:TolC family protein [Candidatus Eisenbacteria bacterium]
MPRGFRSGRRLPARPWSPPFRPAPALLALAALLGAAFPAAAAELLPAGPLTVEDCVRIARDRSDLIEQAEARIESARGARLRSYQSLLPSVSATAGWRSEYVDYFGLAGEQYSISRGISVRQTLFDLPLLLQRKALGAGVTGAEAGLRTTLADVELAARQQFYVCVAGLKLADIEEQAVAVAGEQLRRSETLFRLGSVARSDVLQARVNLADAEQQAMQRRNAVGIEHARLALVLGLDPRTPLTIDSTLVLPAEVPQGDLDAWVAQALQRRPDLRAGRAQLAAAEWSERAARWQRLPSIGANGNWGRVETRRLRENLPGYDQPRDEDSDYSSWSVSVGLSVELFSGLRIEGDIQSAAAGRRQQRANLERMEKEAALEVRNAFNAIHEERESLRAARVTVSLAEENLRLQQALYESGAGTLLEWDNARLGLRRARLTLIQAEISLLLAQARFRQAVGEA